MQQYVTGLNKKQNAIFYDPNDYYFQIMNICRFYKAYVYLWPQLYILSVQLK